MKLAKRAKPHHYDHGTLQALKARDAETQTLVWKAEEKLLLKIARYFISCNWDAKALLQDVFCDFLFHYVDSVRSPQAIRNYLCIMTVRRARRFKERENQKKPIEVLYDTPDPTTQIESLIDEQSLYIWMEEALCALNHKEQKVLKLHYGHDLSYSAIARLEGMSKQAISKKVATGRNKLLRHVHRKQIIRQSRQ